MTLVQISRKSGLLKRVARDEEPIVELQLKPGQRVIRMEFHLVGNASRVTVDWRWTATLEWRAERETEEGVP